MLPQIPLYLLQDTITVEEPDAASEFGSHYLKPYAITGVYVAWQEAAAGVSWAEGKQPSTTVFIDAKHSTPAKCPTLKSRITLTRNGATRSGIVQGIKEFAPMGALHHWEVTLG